MVSDKVQLRPEVAKHQLLVLVSVSDQDLAVLELVLAKEPHKLVAVKHQQLALDWVLDQALEELELDLDKVLLRLVADKHQL